MATINILKRETGHCEKCEKNMSGILFTGVTEVTGEVITIDVVGERFLCDAHFEDFIAANGHRVILEK